MNREIYMSTKFGESVVVFKPVRFPRQFDKRDVTGVSPSGSQSQNRGGSRGEGLVCVPQALTETCFTVPDNNTVLTVGV